MSNQEKAIAVVEQLNQEYERAVGALDQAWRQVRWRRRRDLPGVGEESP